MARRATPARCDDANDDAVRALGFRLRIKLHRLRIEGKNDDTDVNLQGSDFDARASAGVEDARRTRARVVELRFDGSLAFIKLRLAAPSASY